MSRRDFGKKSEDMAIEYLEAIGFKIVDRNFYAKKLGEIDIIATKDNILHFIEVKSAKANFEPIYNITPTKLKKIIESVKYYMQIKNLDRVYSIDALLIKDMDIELIENITI